MERIKVESNEEKNIMRSKLCEDCTERCVHGFIQSHIFNSIYCRDREIQVFVEEVK